MDCRIKVLLRLLLYRTVSGEDSELTELERKRLRLEILKLELEVEKLPLECAVLELQIQKLQQDLMS